MKKILSVIICIFLIFSPGGVSAFGENISDVKYGITFTSESEDYAVTIKNVLGDRFDIDIENCKVGGNNILLEIGGDSCDWSISYDENNKTVMLKGGSAVALKYAVDKFLEYACVFGSVDYVFSTEINYSYCNETDATDNSSLLKYKNNGDSELMLSYSSGLLLTPDWVDSLVMVELRPEMASIGGTLSECNELIDFYASAGVNGIWLPPIYDRGDYGNGYSNYGIDTLEPAITGTDDYDEGWQTVKKFVDYCHSKGIYVFFDIVTWGTVFDSPLTVLHPDWFDGEDWGNAKFNWDNEELRSWFIENAVNNILKTGADGYRCDCEPNYTGYSVYGEIRETLKEKGKNIVIICEDANERKGVYDFEQDGVLDYSATDRAGLYSNPVNFFGDGYLNIVESVKNGKGIGYSGWQNNIFRRGNAKYYINCLTNHDYQKRDINGSEINIGYSAILAPFIPLWYMGDEFNVTTEDGVQYFNYIDYSEINDADNALFLEGVRKMINIRRTYSDIFEYWPANHRNGNICKVETENIGTLQSYARYSDNKAVIVVANNDEKSTGGKVKIPFADCNINGYNSYTVTDLITGKILIKGTKTEIAEFYTYIGYDRVGIYLVEGIGECNGINVDFDRIFDSIWTYFLNILAYFKSIIS